METKKTARPVSGFRGRSGRSFSARLALEQGEDGKWRVEFDEEWARTPRAQPENEGEAEPEAASENGDRQQETANTSAGAAS
jgi:DNA topoisomerase-3